MGYRSAHSLVLLPLFALAACGSSGATSTPNAELSSASTANAGGAGGMSAGIEAALASDFIVQRGEFSKVSTQACCETSCAGNNPSSPYLAFYMPPGPGQTAQNPSPSDGKSMAWRLRSDEAIVYVGTTPPEARYFGFTPYLYDRQAPGGNRVPVFASLSETLNLDVIGTDAPPGATPYERQTAVIAAADAGTVSAVKSALIAQGVPAQAINVLVFDPTVSRFGLDEAADTFNVLFRVAMFADPAQQSAFVDHPPGAVFRVTPRVAAAPAPLPKPTARPKGTSSEEAWEPDVNRLGLALATAFPGYDAQELVVTANTLDPEQCIAHLTSCLGDNRDTNYPTLVPRVLFDPGADGFYLVYGVNHEHTGKVTYANASVYGAQHLYGITSVTSAQYAGSAAAYLPGDPDVDKLYVYKIARSCAGEPYCLEIPQKGCPSGIYDGQLGTIAFRTYLEPTTHTAPDPSTLVRDRVLYFKKR